MLKLKKYLIYMHRYLGMALCVMFALWFVSGIVMMYKRMPRLPAEERLARLAALDFTNAALTPDQAYQRTGWSEAPNLVRLGMFNGRPVYRFLSERGWATVFADDGGRLDRVTPEQALEVVRAFAPEHRGRANYKEIIEIADQWTLGGSLRRFKPLHKVALDDGEGTHLYVSQVTGEVVMKTTRDGRFWGWIGLITFTWILSGLLSMNQGDWSPGNSPTAAQSRAVAGGALNLGSFKLSPVEAIREFRTEYLPKEIELLQFRGRPFYLAYQSPDQLKLGEWLNTDLGASPSAETPLPHLLIAADSSRAKLREFSRDEMMSAARDAMPGAMIVEAMWLDGYDAYYYHRARGRRLPALRVKYDDPQQTWLYFDPKLGAVAQKEETRSRIERWLYNGLHSLDFPYLYQSRPAWDITVIVLSLGGCLLSCTAVWLTWRRVMRGVKWRRFHAPRWRPVRIGSE